MDTLTRLIATFFGVGYFPIWPGAMGSLAAILLAWFLEPAGLWAGIGLSALTGLWACAPSERVFGRKDPQKFVMDEVCGMFLTLVFLPKTLAVYAVGYLYFRIFDAAKPWPISLIQKAPYPSCIMWDDIAAGVAANVLLHLTVSFWPILAKGV